jgi:hypothetical protein
MDAEPLVRVLRGDPAPEEVAALVAALLSRSAPIDPRPAPSLWKSSARPGVARGWIASARLR